MNEKFNSLNIEEIIMFVLNWNQTRFLDLFLWLEELILFC